MKQIILTLITVFSMFCLVACGGEKTSDTNAGGNATDKATVTEAPASEPASDNTSTSTDEINVTPAPEEATPEPTEKPTVVYEGIDMDSTLSGQEWLETFIGVIDEPKIVVFNDNTGKKVIVEQEGEVSFNPDEDAMAIFLPAGYVDGRAIQGVRINSNLHSIAGENYTIFYLDAEKMREKGNCKAGFLVIHGDERIGLIANLIIE